jgi:hypothetical protein
MRLTTLGKNLAATVEFLASLFIILQFLGISEIRVPWSKLTMETIFLPLALVGFFIFPLWVGYQLGIWRKKPPTSTGQQRSTILNRRQRFQTIYGSDELLDLLEELESKGRQWRTLITSPPIQKNTSLVEREAYSYRGNLLNKSAYYLSYWGDSLRVRIEIIWGELERGSATLGKGNTEQGKAHIDAALANVTSLIEYLRSPTEEEERTNQNQSTEILVEPDRRLDHLQVHVFWPPYYTVPILSKLTGRSKSGLPDTFPDKQYVVNYNSKRALGVGSYVSSLLAPIRRIQVNAETRWFPYYQKYWCWKNGLREIPHKATQADLLEGTNLTSLRPE